MKVENIRNIQDLVDEIGFTYKRDGERILLIQAADENYKYDIACRIGFDEKNHCLRIVGQSTQDFPKDKHGELLVYCNNWNRDTKWPKVYTTVYDNGVLDVITEMQMQGLQYDVSADFLKANIQNHLAFNWEFWVKLGKQFK